MVAVVALLVLPNVGDCAETCAKACPGETTPLTVCNQRCRLACFWGRGKQGAHDLAKGEFPLPKGGKPIRIGAIEVVTPEVNIPLDKLVSSALQLKAPRIEARRSQAAAVDMEPEMRRHAIRIETQGKTETCMAQALTSAMELSLSRLFAAQPELAKASGAPPRGMNLSRKHVYSLSLHAAGLCRREHRGSWVLTAASTVHAEGTFLEQHWPWSEWDPRGTQWASCAEAANGGAPSEAALGKRHFFIDDYGYLPPLGWNAATARTPADLEGILEQKLPIVLSVFLVPQSFDAAWHNGGHVRAPAHPMPSYRGAHYVLLVGYDRAQRHFKFANSWGAAFGNQGYGTLDYDYVRRHAIEGLVVKSMRVQTP